MSSIARLCWLLVLMVGVVTPDGADAQSPGGAAGGRTLLAPVAPPRNPYGSLFLLPGQTPTAALPRLKAVPAPPRAVAAPPPTVVCGTRLVPIDPTIDPGIRRVPDASAPRPAIRAVEPTLCR